MADYSWVGPLIGEVAKAGNSYGATNKANDVTQDAYDEMMRALQARFGDYDAIGSAGYQPIQAQEQGRSELGNIQSDAQARMAEQQAIAKLQELADNGGLSLADMKALNDIQANLNRNNSARQQGLANQYAARGQLGSGAQLAMDLSNQQNAAMNANDAGESAAAQAQARALQAILQKGSLARQMGNDDYQRQAAAAAANDAINARNAAARTDANKYANTIKGQGFADKLSIAKGKGGLTGDMNQIIFGKGESNRNTGLANASYTNHLIDKGGGAIDSIFSSENKSSPDSNTYQSNGSASDITDDNQDDK